MAAVSVVQLGTVTTVLGSANKDIIWELAMNFEKYFLQGSPEKLSGKGTGQSPALFC